MPDHPPTYPLVATLVAESQPATLRPKQESFAQLYAAYGNAVRAYREAFDCAPDIRYGTLRQKAYELAHEPAVAGRVREILAQAAEGTKISTRARMIRLQEIVEASPDEIVSIVAERCPHCWLDPLALAAVLDRGLVPDTSAAQGDCASCKGHGVRRVVITPTDDLSPSARKLLKSVRQKADGSIEVRLHDQLAASDQLNKMQGVYVDKSVSINANINVPVPQSVTASDALAFLKSLTPS
jgi:Terminase small subunit